MDGKICLLRVVVVAASALLWVGFVFSPAVSQAATVPATTCGDVNGDQVVNISDVIAIAQLDVGLRPCDQLAHPEACDVNGDGACNIGDALRIAQCYVGRIGCAFTCRPFTCPSATAHYEYVFPDGAFYVYDMDNGHQLV